MLPRSRALALARAGSIGSLLTLLAIAGCASGGKQARPSQAPPGSPAARTLLPDEAMNQFVDLAAQDLGERLPNTPIVRESAYRQVLGLGIIRGAGFASPQAAESGVRRLQSRLNANQLLTQAFRMVDMSRGQSAEILGDVASGSDTTRSPRTSSAASQRGYRPEDVLVLSGDFVQAGSPESGSVTYTFVATVQHPQTRAQVLSYEFRRNYRWDDARTRWIAGD